MSSCCVVHPPCNYSSWVELLETFREIIPDSGMISLIASGSCAEYNGIKGYLHPHIEEAVNMVIANCIKELKRNIVRLNEMQEIDGMNIAFIRFSKKIDASLFFMHIDFLDESFKQELYNEVEKEVYRFWNDLLASIRKNAVSNNNLKLEEELYLIKRIRLFKKYQNS